MRRCSILVGLLLVLAACGDASESTEAPAATDPATTVPQVPTTPAPPTSPAASEAGAQTAQDGDTVAVHYRGTLDDGSEFDSSEGRDPLTFVVGSGQVIRGFDDAVRGLAVGESRTVRIEPADAYGEVDPERVVEVPLDQLPEGVQAGDELATDTGQRVEVVEVADEVARIDTNHPLAGQALTFEVELVSIG